ncbi:MAG: hypothetical protein CME06_00745, partial [Gemmatimonadetes bacterium]|nr:hypothetical protein [Gemmatimonadota bacterium]
AGLLVLFLIASPFGVEIRLYMGVMAISIFTVVISDSAQSLFVAHERLKVPSIVGSIFSGISAIGGGIALLLGGGLLSVFVVIAFAHILVAILNIWLVRREYVGHRFALDPVLAKSLMRDTVPLGLLIVLMIAHGKIDILMLSKIAGGARLAPDGVGELVATGCYGAAYKVFEAAAIVIMAVRGALLPTVSAAMVEGRERVRIAYSRGCRLLTLVYGLPLVLLTPFGARWVVHLLFGAEFDLATVPVMILSFAYALYAYNAIMLPILINSKRLLSFTFYGFLVVAINIGLNWLLIPQWSLYGAAAATLVSTIVMVLIKFRILSQEFGRSALFSIPRSVALPALITLAVALAVFHGLHAPALAVVAGGATYYYGLFRFGVIAADDRALLGKLGGQVRAAIGSQS